MDPKQLALQFFDKAVLGGFAVWLVLTAAGMASQPEGLDKKAELDANLAKIAEHMKGSTVAPSTDAGWRTKLEAQLKAGEVREPPPAPAFALERRPYFLYQVHVDVPTYACKHGAPTDVTADGSQRGQVIVRWKPSLENEYVLCTYEVSRKKNDGAWEVVNNAGPGTTEYIDTNISARATYLYKVTSVGEADRESPVVTRYNLKLAEAETRKESPECGPIQTQSDIFVIPQNVVVVTDQDLIANPNAKESAYVKVYKWDPETSTFQNATFNVEVGKPIGDKKKLRGRGEFDFSTGAVLDDTSIEERPHPKIQGHTEKVQVIRIKFADGSTVDFNDKDKPAELGGGAGQ